VSINATALVIHWCSFLEDEKSFFSICTSVSRPSDVAAVVCVEDVMMFVWRLCYDFWVSACLICLYGNQDRHEDLP
jgi:hypothetical protein